MADIRLNNFSRLFAFVELFAEGFRFVQVENDGKAAPTE